MSRDPGPSRSVLLRDLLIFQLKLWLDGLKDLVLSPVSVGAVVAGMLLKRPGLFYRVLRLGERFDRWLNLYGAAQAAEHSPEGLFGASRAGDPTLLGQLEALAEGAGRGGRRSPPASPGG